MAVLILVDGVRPRNLGYSASATVDIPVWDWLSTQHKVRQSEILRDAAHTALTATQRRLVAQLDESYQRRAQPTTQLQSLEQSVQTATESLRLTRLRYTAGEATVLEVVDAENSLTAAEIAREDGTVRYQLAFTNLQLLDRSDLSHEPPRMPQTAGRVPRCICETAKQIVFVPGTPGEPGHPSVLSGFLASCCCLSRLCPCRLQQD